MRRSRQNMKKIEKQLAVPCHLEGPHHVSLLLENTQEIGASNRWRMRREINRSKKENAHTGQLDTFLIWRQQNDDHAYCFCFCFELQVQ